MRLALTAGGTGGHIIPALVVLDAFRARASDSPAVCFFGPDDRGEREMVEARGLQFVAVPAAAVRGRGPLRIAQGVLRILQGAVVATRRLKAFDPDVVFSTGGYGSFPCSVGARLLRRPLVVYLPDVSPGWAVKAETILATQMATTTEAALAHLPRSKTVVTGYPVRASFFDQTRDQARAQLGLSCDERVVVVAGATQGARALNQAVFGALPALAREATVFHVTGEADYAAAIRLHDSLDRSLGDRYRAAPFRDDLPAVMLAADLAVMRAGASTLGELPAASLPAILVPGKYAGGHQRDNAGWLARAGAAIVIEEDDLAGLSPSILKLLGDPQRLAGMRAAAQGLARPGAAAAIAELISRVALR